MIKTLKNIEDAFAREAQIYARYAYFAAICRELGDEQAALLFEMTARQEILHARGYLELLLPRETLTVAKCLELAIEWERDEYAEIYPQYKKEALQEERRLEAAEMDEQIQESKEHAERFEAILRKAQRRFQTLIPIEERHTEMFSRHLKQLGPADGAG